MTLFIISKYIHKVHVCTYVRANLCMNVIASIYQVKIILIPFNFYTFNFGQIKGKSVQPKHTVSILLHTSAAKTLQDISYLCITLSSN